jgi:outer membrane protein assembly factor BamA
LIYGKEKFFLVFFCIVLGSQLLVAESIFSDSIHIRNSHFFVPYTAYQQETNWLFGLTDGYYFKSNDLSRISSITGSAGYTLMNQFVFNVSPRLYLGSKHWYLYSNLNFQHYYDYFYGIGNQPTNLKQNFTSNNFYLLLQPQFALSRRFYIGGVFSFINVQAETDSTFEREKEYIYDKYGSAGWNEFRELNLGLVTTFDTRDNQFYPGKGFYLKSTLSTAIQNIGSSYSFTQFTLDFRQYIQVFRNHVFAWQALYTGIYSKNEVPFQLLPTIGGSDIMRGFRQGMYRDKEMIVFQSEYRVPVYKRLKAALFCSAGDVMNYSLQINKLKMAYGGGLRYQLNDARVHLRFDIAKNNYGDNLQFYVTAGEAF